MGPVDLSPQVELPDVTPAIQLLASYYSIANVFNSYFTSKSEDTLKNSQLKKPKTTNVPSTKHILADLVPMT